MKEIDLAECEVEEVELMDLGDAAGETRNISPFGMNPDNQYGVGWAGR